MLAFFGQLSEQRIAQTQITKIESLAMKTIVDSIEGCVKLDNGLIESTVSSIC